MNKKGKVILIDWGMILHRSIFAWRKNKLLDVEYIALNQLFSYLYKIGVDKKDLIIIAVDSEKGSWRRQAIQEYKANRKAKREEYEDIDWKALFKKFDNLIDLIEKATPFYVIKIDKLEADDIIAYATKFYKNRECIIVSIDKDFELLWARENVKIFSPLVKFKGTKGAYKICPNKNYPYKLLEKKIKREESDNLISDIKTEEDYELRKIVVDLLELPKYVELLVKKKLKDIKNGKKYDYRLIPYPKIRQRLLKLFYNSGIIKYEECEKAFFNKKSKGGKRNVRKNFKKS